MFGIRSKPKNRTGERASKFPQAVLRYPYCISRWPTLRRPRVAAWWRAERAPFGFEGFPTRSEPVKRSAASHQGLSMFLHPLTSLVFLNIFVTDTGFVCKL